MNMKDIMETVQMIEEEHLDIRTITMGISLLDPAADTGHRPLLSESVRQDHPPTPRTWCRWERQIEAEYGHPHHQQAHFGNAYRHAGGGLRRQIRYKYALTLDRAAKEVGVNFIGGYSALVHKGFAAGDQELIDSIPRALAQTEIVCSSVNIGSTKTGHQHGRGRGNGQSGLRGGAG